ncbi:MAG TPA: hypothetical protein VHA71_09075 [Rhodanobacteraceae bacterium]|nr:hypothetical protein [Rhodanobacteraceae bacterium]
MNIVRSFFLLVPILVAGQASAIEPYTCQNEPNAASDIKLAEIVGTPGARVNFRLDGIGCPDAPSCIVPKPFLSSGKRVLVTQTTEGWACAWGLIGQSDQWGFQGWISAKAIKFLDVTRHPHLRDWIGTWKLDGVDQLKISASNAGTLRVTGEARWYGPVINGERDVHYGSLDGHATPVGSRLYIGRNLSKDQCKATLLLIDGYLVVTDNNQCGGVNARFNGVFKKER